MNVVILDSDVSYPTTSGKRLRTLNLMLPLAGRHHLHYIARGRGDAEQNRQAVAFLRDHGIETTIIDDPLPGMRRLGFYLALAGNVVSPLPYSVVRHQSAAFRRGVVEATRGRRVDLWQVEWTGYLDAVPDRAAPTVVQAHNVDSLIWQRYHEAERNPLRRWYIRQQWRKFRRFEGAAFRRATRVVAVSPEDAALAGRLYGVENVDVVDNGVDIGLFRSMRPNPTAPTILFLGSLDWRPNLDAATVLLQDIFPAVAAQVPGARLWIVGRTPPEWLRRRVECVAGVELHADVPDVRPYLTGATLMVVPLRIGGGSRLKILEALAAGLPVVSTAVGAEGLTLTPGVDYTRADSPGEMAAALVEALRQPEAALTQAQRGRETVAARYDWSMLAQRLEAVWERACGRGGEGEAVPAPVSAGRTGTP